MRSRYRNSFFVPFAVIPWLLHAHPISLSTVVANVETNQVTVEMKILVEDLMLFQDLQPNEQQILPADALHTASTGHHQFLLDYFQIRTLDGAAVKGEVLSTDTEEIPDQGVPLDAVMSTSIYYALRFPLAGSVDYLTFSQNFGGDTNPLPSVMDLIVLQNNARLGYPVQISPKNPHSVELDWENPPTNDRKSWRERRALMRQRREELLGITSYSMTYSYIYITDTDIRHEILVPLLTLETWLSIERKDPDFLEIDEQESAVAVVESYFQTHGKVKIDGLNVPAKVSRVDFYGLNFRDFAQRAPKQRVSIHNARAGIILNYPAKTPPKTLQMNWDTFNKHTPLLNSVVYVGQDKGFRQFFTPAEPTLEWTAPESQSTVRQKTVTSPPIRQPVYELPLVSSIGILGSMGLFFLGLAKRSARLLGISIGSGLIFIGLWTWPVQTIAVPIPIPPEQIIATETANDVFATLHGNIYRVFDYNNESQIYDVLSESVSGDLLESLYLKIRAGLRMEEQGGAIARVTSTTIRDHELLKRTYVNGNPTFTYRCTWNIAGTVEHWGHIHTRENQYKASFTIVGFENRWKITDFEVESEKRLGFQTKLRETK
ncbi:MAG: hypothetical protein M2R45_00110 [Verrucomicrobia subdivision 3 bacterium]|nr:hypothetical protein [Limisphaerales bacterium]MCS1412430.1 hypothetical protein [Limisphaerales bacterium]